MISTYVRRLLRALASIAILTWSLCLTPAPIAAATRIVNSCGSNASTVGTLPYWIANAGAGDVITFSVDCVGGSAITPASTLTISQNLTVSGNGRSIVVDGANARTILAIAPSVAAQLDHLTIQHGSATQACLGQSQIHFFCGGGIFNEGTLTIASSLLASNTAPDGGGGLYNAGTVTITESAFVGNTTTGSLVGGGGIMNEGTALLVRSTLSGNTTASAFGGGGVFNERALTVTNSTLSGNTAPSGMGGGIMDYYDVNIPTQCALTLTNSTLAGNTASSGGGVGNANNCTTVHATNALIAGNSASNNSPDYRGTFTAASHTLLGTASGATGITDGTNGNIVGHPAGIGTLGRYGGPTQTIPLLPGSLAIDTGDDSTCAAPAPINPGGVDQRNFPRPQGAHCDIGAFEYAIPTALPATKPPGPAGGLPSPLPGMRPTGSTGGSAPNPLPAPRP